MLSAAGSGTGKTTITAALLRVLCQMGKRVQCFKCGCDYIDPMFHRYITGRKAYQADPFFLNQFQMQKLVSQVSADADISVLEGAMGYYDGIAGTSEASAYTVSMWLNTPVLFILKPQGMGCSVGAICKGFQQFRESNQIKGVLLNQIRPGMYDYYKKIIEQETDLKVYGYLPDLPEIHFESRHLGLLTAEEIPDLDQKLDVLAETAKKTLDLDGILKLAASVPSLPIYPQMHHKPETQFRLGIAFDRAFCFYYQENLDLLEQYGAELIYFSPLTDARLPDGLDGLYFGGGYPELYLPELSQNDTFLKNLKQVSALKIPIFAECGGFLYLQEFLDDADHHAWPMAGLLPGHASMGKRLCRFGYMTLTAQEGTLLGTAGTCLRGHEFHYADSTENGSAFLAERPSGKKWLAIQNTDHITAGFPHLYFLSAPEAAKYFCQKCKAFHNERNDHT